MSPAAEIFDVTVVLTQRRAIHSASGSSRSPQGFIFVTLTTFPLASQVSTRLPVCRLQNTPHLGTVFPEPLSISGQHVIDGMAPGLDGSVLVTVDAFLDQGILANIPGQLRKKCRGPDSGKAMNAFCSRGNEQSPEFLAGRPVKKSSLTQPFYRP